MTSLKETISHFQRYLLFALDPRGDVLRSALHLPLAITFRAFGAALRTT